MDQLGFNGGGPGASSHAKYVQRVVELNLRCKAAIQYTRHRLLKDPDKTNAAEVAIPLWDQDNGLSAALLHEATLPEGGLDQANMHLPL